MQTAVGVPTHRSVHLEPFQDQIKAYVLNGTGQAAQETNLPPLLTQLRITIELISDIRECKSVKESTAQAVGTHRRIPIVVIHNLVGIEIRQ